MFLFRPDSLVFRKVHESSETTPKRLKNDQNCPKEHSFESLFYLSSRKSRRIFHRNSLKINNKLFRNFF